MDSLGFDLATDADLIKMIEAAEEAKKDEEQDKSDKYCNQ